MGKREQRKLEFWKLSWPGRGNGRYWKRKLSKARRRYSNQMIKDGRGKSPANYETECNYKTY